MERHPRLAEGFAKGHRGILNANPVVFSYQPSPSEIAFVFDERGEAEFVFFSEPKGGGGDGTSQAYRCGDKAARQSRYLLGGDGLFLRIRKGGFAQWFFVYKRGGKRTEIGLGGYGQGTAPVSFALARTKADDIRAKLARSIHPREERKPVRVITFKHCMDELLASKADGWKNDKHRAQWHMTLQDYAEPLHDMPIERIAIGDVKACLMPHWQERPVTADRLRARVSGAD